MFRLRYSAELEVVPVEVGIYFGFVFSTSKVDVDGYCYVFEVFGQQGIFSGSCFEFCVLVDGIVGGDGFTEVSKEVGVYHLFLTIKVICFRGT